MSNLMIWHIQKKENLIDVSFHTIISLIIFSVLELKKDM